MKVVFYGNRKGNFVDKGIRWWTSNLKDKVNGNWKDSFSHVELVFSTGQMFSASQYSNSTRFANFNSKDPAWVTIDVKLTSNQELIIQEFCTRHNGAKYDYLGVLGFIFGNRDNSGKWFCSEICTVALQKVGLLPNLEAAKVSPNALYNSLTSK